MRYTRYVSASVSSLPPLPVGEVDTRQNCTRVLVSLRLSDYSLARTPNDLIANLVSHQRLGDFFFSLREKRTLAGISCGIVSFVFALSLSLI